MPSNPTMPLPHVQSPLLHEMTRRWWLLLLRGIAAIAFGVLAFMWPALTLLTLANLFYAWNASGGVRAWWLAAALAALADRLLTFAYFIPTMVRLMDAP